MDTNVLADSAASSPEDSVKATGKTLLFKDEVFQVVGCAIEVLNTLGHGLAEKPYENALGVEFSLRNIVYRHQRPFRGNLQEPENRPVCTRPDRFRFHHRRHESN
jgi:hypothetical protein